MSSELRDAISILPLEDLDRLSQGATCEECAEALSDYAINLKAERDALRLKLIETAQELLCMIEVANAKLEQGICSTDDTPPDYFDAQTVQEAMLLANPKIDGAE